MRIQNIFFLLLFFSPQLLRASTYYVDTKNPQSNDNNPGSEILPWKTIEKSSTTMAAGDTTIVKAGDYLTNSVTTRSGSAGNRITFKATGLVNIQGFTISHAYVSVDGFTLPAGGQILINTNASFCEVLNNRIVGGWINFSVEANTSNCRIKGNHLYGAKSPEGDFPQIQLFGTNHIVEGNEIGPSSDIDAFRIFGSGHIIRNNYVHNITYSVGSKAHMDMFQTFGDNGWVSNNIIIENNRFIDSEGQLFNTSQDNVSGIHDYIVRNNVFAHINQNANFGLPNFYFYNNTLYETGILYLVTGGPGKPFNATNTVIKNNILIGLAGCLNNDFDNVYNNPSNLQLTKSNNFYSSCNGSSLVRFVNEPAGINGGAIKFKDVSANDFSLLVSSPALDKGLILNGYNYDLLGNARDQGKSWDLGAYEYNSSGANPIDVTTPLNPPTHLKIKSKKIK